MLSNPSSIRQNVKYWTKMNCIGPESLSGTLKFYACKILLWLFPSMDLERRHKRKRIIFVLADLILETAFLLTFMFSEYRTDQQPSRLHLASEYLLYIRLERLTWLGGVFGAWLVLLVLILLLPTFGLAFLMLQLLFKRKLSLKYKSLIIYIPFYLIHSFIQISIISTLVEAVKYGVNPNISYIKDFKFDSSISSTGIAVGGVSLLCLNFSLNYIVRLAMAEFRHDLIHLVPYAKAGIRIDIYKTLAIHLIIISYYNLMYSHPWLHYLLSFAGCAYMWVLYFLSHPYYDSALNSAFSSQFAVVGFVALAHLVGELMGDGLMSLILSIVVTPFVAMIGWLCISWKYSKLKYRLLEDAYKLNDERELELLLRPYLLNKSPEAVNIIKILRKNPELKDKGLLNILDSYYSCFEEDDKNLGRIKLSNKANMYESFEIYYQEFKCRKILEHDDTSETLKFMKFCRLLTQTQNYDKILCYSLKDLWSDLSLNNPNPKLIRSKVVKIQDLLNKATSGYNRLIEKYPTRHCLYQHYGTLLSSICNDTFKYNEYLQKSEFLRSEFKKSSQLDSLNLFHPNAGIIIVSCHPNIFGKIVYVNEEALNILEFDYQNLLGSAFTDLIPDVFKNYHTLFMQNLINERERTSVEAHPKILFYMTSQHYIVPVYCKIRLDAYGNYPCYIVSISKLQHPLQLALINPIGTIMAHSKDFGVNLGIREKYINHDNIFHRIPGMNRSTTHLRLFLYELRVVRGLFRNQEINLAVMYMKPDQLPDYLRMIIYGNALHMSGIIKAPILPKRVKTKNSVRIVELSHTIDEESKHDQPKNSNTIEDFDRFYEMKNSKVSTEFGPKSTLSHSISSKSKSSSFEIRNRQFIENFLKNIKSLKIAIGISVISI